VKIKENATAIYLDTREKQSSHLQDPRGRWGRCWCCVPRLYNWETSVKRFSDVSLSLGFAQWGHQFGIFSQPSFFTKLDSEAGKRTHSKTWWIGDILPNKCWVPFPTLVSIKKTRWSPQINLKTVVQHLLLLYTCLVHSPCILTYPCPFISL
jgi:hypothetical protein